MNLPFASPLDRPGPWFAVFLLLLGLACLWPYNFFQQNRVEKTSDAVRFTSPGTAFTTSPLPLKRPGGPFTLLLRFTPRRPPENAWIAHWGQDMSIYNLLVGQFSNQLLVDLRTGGRQRRARVFLPGQVRPDTSSWMAVCYDGALLEVYIDGIRKGGAAAHIEEGVWDAGFPLVLGSHANGKFPWNGEISRFALFERAVAPGELQHPEELLRTAAPAVRYDFAAATAEAIPDRGSSSPHASLTIPPRYRPAYPSPLVPPQNYWQRGPLYRDMIANVVLFLPFGVLLGALLRPTTPPAVTVAMVILCSAAASAGIEFLQALLPTRWSSFTDLVTNTVGGGLGALAFTRGWVDAAFRWLALRFRGGDERPSTTAP
jgi:hypothetical protein